MDWQGNLTGYLQKRGNGTSMFGRKSWKKRFFVLEDGRLKYYENQHTWENKHDPFGFFILKSYVRVETVKFDETGNQIDFGFKLITPRRVLLIKADSEEERKTWMKAIEENIKRGQALGASFNSESSNEKND